MKTMTILMIVSALAVGGQYYGVVDFRPLGDKVIAIAKEAELIEGQPRHTVIGLDITAGREQELAKDRQAIADFIGNARLGDRIEVFLIHSKSESDQEAVFIAELPTQAGAVGQELVRAKKRIENDWAECWDKKVVPLMTSDRKQRTDLFGFMRYVSTKNDFLAQEEPVLIMFTDGQQVGDGVNMEKRIPTGEQLTALQDEGLVPELENLTVNFMGVTPTHGVTNAHWRKLQTFWKEYGTTANVRSVKVTSDRGIKRG